MNVPQLRFKEFDGEWIENSLGEKVSKIGSGSTPLGGEQSYSNAGIPFIRSQNVNDNKLILDDIVYISDSINNKMKGSIVKANDILLNITGASLGRSCIVPINFLIGNVNQHVCIIRLTSDMSTSFVQSFLASHNGQKQILSSQVGSGREGLNLNSIKSLKLFIPQLPEQTKIANFLTAIDERINQLTRKKELMTQYKQGVMQQIFSQQLRFKDDNGEDFADWEEKKLGEILTIGNGKDYKHLSFGNIPVFGTGGLMTTVNDFLHDGETVCIGRKGTIDKPMYFNGKFWTVDTLFYTHSFKNVLPKFVFTLFQLVNWKEYNEATGVPSLSKSTIYKITVNIPTLPEQTKIANFLTVIDEKIQQISQQIDATKQYKQGLLQQMFV